jgi:hypothetical protein
VSNLPKTLLGRFGVIKLWPDIKVAEDENIERLKKSAHSLGLECIVVDWRGRLMTPPFTQMTQKDLDFVIHLHFETPKAYNIFSFVTLWNPEKFFHDWGYRKYTTNLLSHDDFLSCNGTGADKMISRMICNDPTRLKPFFKMFCSLSEPIMEPGIGEGKLFYAGINWERLGKGKSRHQEVLKMLDSSGSIKIYGPQLLHGVKVWGGYRGYMGELPFDGISMVRALNQAGIALVLSSEAHLESEMSSNRLFEALAAGVVSICDENPFFRKYFGDTLLYVDTSLPANKVVDQIKSHINWVIQNPPKAIELARKAQEIFQKEFRLDSSLKNIYEGLLSRKTALEERCLSKDIVSEKKVHLYLVVKEYDRENLKRLLSNACSQNYQNIRLVLAVDIAESNEGEVLQLINEIGASIELRKVNFKKLSGAKKVSWRKMGSVIRDILITDPMLMDGDLFCINMPNETIFADHISRLVGALNADPGKKYSYCPVLIPELSNNKGNFFISWGAGLTNLDQHTPGCYAQRLFVWNSDDPIVDNLLPYLDHFAPVALSGLIDGAKSHKPTLLIESFQIANLNSQIVNIEQERNIIRDQNPFLFDSFDRAQYHGELSSPEFVKLLRRLPQKQKRRIFIDLLRNTLLPGFIYKKFPRFKKAE